MSFAEAASVFSNPLAKIFDDPDHSAEEPREIIVGHSSANRLLLVIFTERSKDFVRIISARCFTKKERSDYEGYLRGR